MQSIKWMIYFALGVYVPIVAILKVYLLYRFHPDQ